MQAFLYLVHFKLAHTHSRTSIHTRTHKCFPMETRISALTLAADSYSHKHTTGSLSCSLSLSLSLSSHIREVQNRHFVNQTNLCLFKNSTRPDSVRRWFVDKVTFSSSLEKNSWSKKWLQNFSVQNRF